MQHRERLINRRRQGDLGEASAVEWLTRMGANVLLPFGHSPDYDLVAEVDSRLLRIQVKTSTDLETRPNGQTRYQVQLATNGGNQSWSGVARKFDPSRFDYLFVLAGDGGRWFIPATAIEGTTNVTLGGTKYSEYRIEPGLAIQQIVYGNGAPLESNPSEGEYRSGQTGRPVKSLAMPSEVRILPPPSPVSVGQTRVWPKRRITIPLGPATVAGVDVGDRMRVQAKDDGILVLARIDPSDR